MQNNKLVERSFIRYCSKSAKSSKTVSSKFILKRIIRSQCNKQFRPCFPDTVPLTPHGRIISTGRAAYFPISSESLPGSFFPGERIIVAYAYNKWIAYKNKIRHSVKTLFQNRNSTVFSNISMTISKNAHYVFNHGMGNPCQVMLLNRIIRCFSGCFAFGGF